MCTTGFLAFDESITSGLNTAHSALEPRATVIESISDWADTVVDVLRVERVYTALRGR
jgi:hypothetical protein